MGSITAETNGVNGTHQPTKPDYDVIIIGAGFAGLRMIHEVRKLGLSYKVVEAGSSVGGTWYWNRSVPSIVSRLTPADFNKLDILVLVRIAKVGSTSLTFPKNSEMNGDGRNASLVNPRC